MKTIIDNFQLNARRVTAEIDAAVIAIAAEKRGIPASVVRNGIILGRSVDSRKSDPLLVYKILLDVDEKNAAGLCPATEAELAALRPAELELPASRLSHPVVVGTGPAGIFGALALALAGCRPVVIDRGAPVEERCRNHTEFLRTRVLDEESNLLIGEGGAGTFSDGKLYTGTRDPRGRFVIESLIAAGAPPEIRYRARPHVGSDYLRSTCAALRRRIIALGGEFRFHSGVARLLVNGGAVAGVKLTSGETVEAPAVLFAPGLGGRELALRTALEFGCAELKPFQIGCRIEHPQNFIDRCQYHGSRPECLGAAEYHLSASGVSSFCMCPGGTLVNASAWSGRSSTNGMSCYARAGHFANACLITTLRPEDADGSLDAAFDLIGGLERELFIRGGGDYAFPAQDAAAFISGTRRLSRRNGSAETGTVPERIDDLLPEKARSALRGALRFFDRKMPGFIRDGVLVGIEPCVSSPLRIVRNPDGECAAVSGLYPAGEGVGAAGGIVSAACDGIRCAEAMMRNFR